jgi:hypothetical protein
MLPYEKMFVAERSLRSLGSNMIPGGEAVLAFAAKFGGGARAKKWERREIASARLNRMQSA